MPPWWVYKNHGERSDHRLARFLSVLPCKRFDCVGLVFDVYNLTIPLTTLRNSLYQVLVIVLRDGVEPNSFVVKLRIHQSPVYPAGVRGVDLSF